MLENNFNISIPDEWLNGNEDDFFVLSVKDNSYHPHFNEGDLLIICRDLSKLEENDIRVYEINGAFELRKYVLINNFTEILEGITPFIPPLIYSGFELCGFVYMRISNYRQGAADYGTNETN